MEFMLITSDISWVSMYFNTKGNTMSHVITMSAFWLFFCFSLLLYRAGFVLDVVLDVGGWEVDVEFGMWDIETDVGRGMLIAVLDVSCACVGVLHT